MSLVRSLAVHVAWRKYYPGKVLDISKFKMPKRGDGVEPCWSVLQTWPRLHRRAGPVPPVPVLPAPEADPARPAATQPPQSAAAIASTHWIGPPGQRAGAELLSVRRPSDPPLSDGALHAGNVCSPAAFVSVELNQAFPPSLTSLPPG